MRRPIIAILCVALVFGCGAVLAQSGALAGVTMRVVADLAGLEAVLLELPAASPAN